MNENVNFRHKGAGIQPNRPNMLPGDLYITLKLKPNQKFSRSGSDLVTFLDISFIDCMLGKEVEVKTLCGKILKLGIPSCTPPGRKFKISGYGMPNGKIRKNEKKETIYERGNLIVEVRYIIPKSINAEQRKLLEQFRNEVNSS